MRSLPSLRIDMELGPLFPQEGFLIGGLLFYLVTITVTASVAYLVIRAAVRKGVLEALTQHHKTLRAGESPETSPH